MNNYFTEDVVVLPPSERARANIKALQLLAQEKEEYTPEEQHAISLYTGWGDRAILNYAKNDLLEMFGEESAEMESIQAGSLNQHYTHPDVVDAMHELLEWAGIYEREGVLEIGDFSAGSGRFNSRQPRDKFARSHWTELDKDIHSARVLNVLHPESRVLCGPFEKSLLPRNFYDIAMTNVPFANIRVDHQGRR